MKIVYIITLSLIFFLSCKKNDSTNNTTTIPPIIPESKVPKLATNQISNLTHFSAIASGKIIDTVGSKLTEQGIVIGTSSIPTITNNVNKISLQVNANNEISISLTNITPNAVYYIRAYGINSYGVGYGNEITFTSLKEKIYIGNVTLSTQQEVIDFGANNYTTINGSLTIRGLVNNLNPLDSLAIINSGFTVQSTNSLLNFAGLENLEEISGSLGFIVQNNQALTSFKGLDKLRENYGAFQVLNNPELLNFSGLNNYTYCNGTQFYISDCVRLKNLSGLEKLIFISGDLVLKNNQSLTDIKTLTNLSTIGKRIYILNNASLQTLDGLEKIQKLEDGIDVENNISLKNINGIGNLSSIPSLNQVGEISIVGNILLTDLSAFNKITLVDYLNISDNNSLLSLNGFSNIQSINGGLNISNNSSLIDLSGLEKITKIRSLSVSLNNSLVNLKGLNNLTTITSGIAISRNQKLQNLDGLQKLTSVTASIQIFSNVTLTNFCALKSLFLSGYNSSFLAQNNGTNPTQTQVINNCP